MITEDDLREAIAECEGVRNPNANICIKLAAFYTIRDHLFPSEKESFPVYSMATESMVKKDLPMLESDTDFAKTISHKDEQKVMMVIDELMSTLQVLHPRLYDGAMRRLTDV